MTQAQHGMWLTERAGLGGAVHHLPLRVRFAGPLDAEALLAACAAVVARHPALTAAFPDGQAVYGAAKPPIGLAQDPDADPDDEAAQPFDLESGPLARFMLYRRGEEDHLLQVVAHHLVFDGVSKDLLLADLARAYGGADLPPAEVRATVPAEARSAALAEASAEARTMDPADARSTVPEAPNADISAVEGGSERAARFWESRWRDDPTLLPGDGTPSPRPKRADSVTLYLGDLRDAAQALQVTRFEALVTGLILVLYGYGNDRPAVAVDVSTRTPETEDAIGHHANELPVFVTPEGTYRETAAAVRAELRAAYRHRQVPVPRAVRGISPRSALKPVTVSFRERGRPEPVFAGVETEVDWAVPTGWIRGSLHVQVVDELARLHAGPGVRGDEVAEHLRAVLRADPDLPIAALPLPARLTPAAPGHAGHGGSGTPVGSSTTEAGAGTGLLRGDGAALTGLVAADGVAVTGLVAADGAAVTGLVCGDGVVATGLLPGDGAAVAGLVPAEDAVVTGPLHGDGVVVSGLVPGEGAADPVLVAKVLEIFREALQIDDVQIDDDLFDLGGHSLTVTTIIGLVKERLAEELSFEVFIDTPTVTGVAGEIARTRC
ncbi:condensation domain-containing protein [Nonomuraea sp. NPDC050663]|uniref:condensation domain-containing protein n=1 Tax=Nonomuraea sp. NPDC050663 TaxID=3364370 RepID=UPI0037948C0B